MHPFVQTASSIAGVVLPIVGGIILLSLWFKVSQWFFGEGKKPGDISIRGVLGKNTFAAVHMAGGPTFDRVRLTGFLSVQNMKTHLPFQLDGMVILEDEQGQRHIVRAKNIKMIVVPPEQAAL